MSDSEPADWCEVDDCPASICNGPHISHHCPNGDLVSQRYDNPAPCPFCGWTPTTVHIEPPKDQAVTIHVDGPPLEPPIGVLLSRAEREWIDAMRRRSRIGR